MVFMYAKEEIPFTDSVEYVRNVDRMNPAPELEDMERSFRPGDHEGHVVVVPYDWVSFVTSSICSFLLVLGSTSKLLDAWSIWIPVALCLNTPLIFALSLVYFKRFVFKQEGIWVQPFWTGPEHIHYSRVTRLLYKADVYGSSPQLHVFHRDDVGIEKRLRIMILGRKSKRVLSCLSSNCQVRIEGIK